MRSFPRVARPAALVTSIITMASVIAVSWSPAASRAQAAFCQQEPRPRVPGGKDEISSQRHRQAGNPDDQVDRACCGYTVRTTRKWLDQGYPLCPHGPPMHEE